MLEMDDVLEGGGDRHDKILTDIAAKITFGKIKEVALFDEGVLFNGRRWFQNLKNWRCDVPRHGLHQDEDRTHRPREGES